MREGLGLEVIVVDNGSRDNTLSLIRDKYPQTKVIVNEQNLGPCKARNQGIEISSGKWVLVLDSDVVLDESFFQNIKRILTEIPLDVGMIQPKILNVDKTTIYSTGIFLSFLRRFHDVGQGQADSGKFNNAGYIFGACSAAALYRRVMLQQLKEKTGYFDERFFFLVEDVDLAWRARMLGWKAFFSPQATCFHKGNSSSTGKKLRQYLCLRNRYYTIIKNEGFARYAIKILPLLCYDIPRFFYLVVTNPYLFLYARPFRHRS